VNIVTATVATVPSRILAEADELLRKNPRGAAKLLVPYLDGPGRNDESVIHALLLGARAHIYIGTLDEGNVLAERARRLAHDMALPILEGLAYNELGILCFVAADYDGAMAAYEKALQFLEGSDEETGLMKVRLNMANVYHRRTDFIKSVTLYEQVLASAQKLGDEQMQAKVMHNMASFYEHFLNDTEAGIAFFRKSIELYQRAGDVVGLSKAYANLSSQYRTAGDNDKAMELLEQSLAMRKDEGEPDEIMQWYNRYIQCLLYGGEIARARVLVNDVLQRPHAQTDSAGAVYARLANMYVHYFEGNIKDAYEIGLRELVWLEEHDIGDVAVEVRETLAQMLDEAGETALALDMYKRVLEDRMRLSSARAETRLLYMKARFDTDQAAARAEIERLRNVELASAVRRLEESNREKSEYLAFMAHELKGPLSTIRLIASLLSDNVDLSDEHRQDFNKHILQISSRMFDMINTLLDRARTQHPDAEDVGVVDALMVWQHVLKSWHLRAAEKGIVLRVAADRTTYPVRITEQVLVSIIENLVSNAVKFSPASTTVDVDIRTTTHRNDSACLRLSVRDQGPGLTKEDLGRLFEPFRQLSSKPTRGEDSSGLGLYIIKRDIERIGGFITCESTAGEGATFIVDLPLEAAA